MAVNAIYLVDPAGWQQVLARMNKIKNSKKQLPPGQREELLKALEARFEKNMNRHKGLEWLKVKAKLEPNPEKLWSLNEMERTGGEPDVVGQDKKTGEYVFFDCSAQTPSDRVSLCYDDEALEARKENKPKGSALGMAAAMGVELLTEEQYFELQKLGEFDTKRSSWIKTPADIRKLGGALYCDRRYGRVFVGHNGADSYYSGRASVARLESKFQQPTSLMPDRTYEFVQLDVFTQTPLTGNPLAVFTDARGLDDGEMQAVAREMNLSETTFILPRDPATEAREGNKVRIFTVAEELPFAGHPTLGTALHLYASKFSPGPNNRPRSRWI